MTRLIFAILASAAFVVPAFAVERSVTLAVDNMTCRLCPPIVKQSLERVPGVKKAEVSSEKGTAIVVFDDQETNVAAFIGATTNAGYPSRVAEH